MAEKKISNWVSYIALGVSVVALAVAIFGNCHKRPHARFGGEYGPRPEMMVGQRGGEHGFEQRGPQGGEFRGQPQAKGKQGFGGKAGPRPDAPKQANN